ncbi:MAG: murein biosynthesis integral membrane protein MurJ [Chloroflexi bacterium]|nr:murein biosynthesis integral membrane protein MurJ [Chloroflexota bacterium]
MSRRRDRRGRSPRSQVERVLRGWWGRLTGGGSPSPDRHADAPIFGAPAEPPPPLFEATDDWLVPERPATPLPPPRPSRPARRPPMDEADEDDESSGFSRFLRLGSHGVVGWQSRSVMGAATIVAAGFVVSRLLGLLRSVAIADSFGTEPELAAYWVAFRLPDLVFQLLAGGTVSAAFIPVFSRVTLERGDGAAWRLASSVLNLLSVATFALAALAFVLAGRLVPLLAPGLGEGTAREAELASLAVNLTRLMLISPIVFGASGLITGILNARHRFVAAALAPVMYNLAIIAGALFLSGPFGVYGLAWGVVLGALLHLLVQLPEVMLLGMRWTPALAVRSRAVRDVMRLMGPRVIGLAASQANFVVLVFFASFISDPAISAINFAFLVMMMPVGVVGMAISTAAFPTLARQAASQQIGALRESLSAALRSILFLAVPASFGLIVLARPSVRLLFQHGQFDAESTSLVTAALMVFAIAIAAHSAIEILSRGFYALSDTRTPVQLAVLAMLLNVVLATLLVSPFGLRGLAAATSIAALFECVLLAYVLHQRLEGFGRSGVWRSLTRTLIAAAVMAEVLVLLRLLIGAGGISAASTGGAFVHVVGVGALGLVTYLGVSWAVNREEFDALFTRVG